MAVSITSIKTREWPRGPGIRYYGYSEVELGVAVVMQGPQEGSSKEFLWDEGDKQSVK